MSWKCFQLTFAQRSEICVGFHKLGWVQRTRYFIPSRNLWAAATALNARRMASLDYKNGDVDLILRFTPLYLADASGSIHFPWVEGAGFESDNVSSRGRATIAPDSATAMDGGLFDMEYLARRPGFHWTGYAWASGEMSEEGLRALLARIEIGGERRYGMGVLALLELRAASSVFGCDWVGSFGDPQVTLPKDSPAPAHLLLDGCPDGVTVSGEIEPLTGRATNSPTGFGQAPVPMQLCWMPGAVVDHNQTFAVGSQGLWRFATT